MPIRKMTPQWAKLFAGFQFFAPYWNAAYTQSKFIQKKNQISTPKEVCTTDAITTTQKIKKKNKIQILLMISVMNRWLMLLIATFRKPKGLMETIVIGQNFEIV